MNNYKVWNRKDSINGVKASYFLKQSPFDTCKSDIILIYADNGKVSNIECKDILAKLYDIDIELDTYEFMTEYFRKLEELNKNNESVE
jgi:hypothetical protein